MDLVLLGGTVLTMDASSGRAEALAVEGGKIAAVGPSAEVSKLVGPETRVVHLSGRAVIPGIVDAHNHFGMTVWEPVSVDCRMPPLNGINEVKDAIGAAASAAPAGQWIWGLGFEALTWGEKRRVTREELDEVAPNNPVCIMDYYYHACYANSAALKLAGFDRDTPDPERGWILKDGNGEPDGTLWESAMNPVHRMSMRAHIDQYGEEGVAGLVHQNCLRHLSLGITSVGDALVTPESAEVYRIADRLNKLPIMIHQMRGGDEFYRPPVKASKGEYTGDNVSDRLRGNIMKIFMDPVYPDNADVRHHHDGSTEHVGHRNYTQEEVDSLVLDAAGRDIQVAIHCIGEWGIEQGLNAFERAAREHPRPDPRFRIEHLTYPTLSQIKRAKSLGVIVSHQPAFLSTVGDMMRDHVEEMGIDAPPYPVASLLAEGIPMAAGSDFPCSLLDPRLGLYAMTTRSVKPDAHLVAPEEAVSVMDGLRMYTMGSAYAMFRENEVGSLERGKRADLVVLSHDPTGIDPSFIQDVKVQQTYVDGELLFELI